VCVDCVANAHIGIRTFDTGDWIIGGKFTGDNAAGGAGIYAQEQGPPGDMYIQGVMAIAGSGQPAILIGAGSGANGSNINIENSLIGCQSTGTGCAANTSALSIGANSVVKVRDSNFVSTGTGTGITNAGAYYDLGGNTQFLVGSGGQYSGAGTVNGTSTLTGSAYTNSTTTFSNVVGSAGETFAWNVYANATLNVTCHLYYQAAATGGLNIEFTGPASPTTITYSLTAPTSVSTINTATATAYSTSLGAAVVTATTNFDALVTLQLQNGTTTGTVNLLAKSSAAVNLTIQPGSYCQSN
jgi:hypothetical protein